MSNVEIGVMPVPGDIQIDLGVFVTELSSRYDLKQGETAFFWALMHLTAQHLGEPLE